MHLIQLYLPVKKPDGSAFPPESYSAVRQRLTEAFGGVTAYTRAPARGFWKEHGTVEVDDIFVFEVVVGVLDRFWWSDYLEHLKRSFNQQSILARAHVIEIL